MDPNPASPEEAPRALPRVKWVTDRGTPFVLVDFRGLQGDEALLSVLHEHVAFLRNVEGKPPVLLDFTDAHAGTLFLNEANRLGKEYLKEKTPVTALLGIRGYKKILFGLHLRVTGSRELRLFDDEASALAWFAEAIRPGE